MPFSFLPRLRGRWSEGPEGGWITAIIAVFAAMLFSSAAAAIPNISNPTGSWRDEGGVLFVVTHFETIYYPDAPRSRDPRPDEEEGEARVLLVNRTLETRSGTLRCALFHDSDMALWQTDPVAFSLEPLEVREVDLTSPYLQSASSMSCGVELTESTE
ncbi:hypothetical protein L5876_13950 [Hyphobacterium sp. SN044]|uniref:hypothetical protein n=1 Tax=Hyphobacterium sp. SN044 TaxID=2912575 RepID=UPI001F375DB1|nr:hypothetical protein [Hyphobacterium sp. SN044]MCF8880928.1 hypothetical protein [Hyphobacterium sp. SN044]